MDSLFHGPDWTPRADFIGDVAALAATESWITEWQYTSKGTDPILAPRADTVLWLDYPYRTVRRRLLQRTWRRSLTREVLWNGNRERPIWRIFRETEDDNILAWQKATILKWSERMPGIEERYPHLRIVRFEHPREAQRWLRTIARSYA